MEFEMKEVRNNAHKFKMWMTWECGNKQTLQYADKC